MNVTAISPRPPGGRVTTSLWLEMISWYGNSSEVRLLGGLLVAILIAACPPEGYTEQFRLFKSEDYGFVMKYPAGWIKNERPEGKYYIVFEAPELLGNFRCRIHVAVHAPVTESLADMVQELRNGIGQLKDKSGIREGKEGVQFLDEGPFKCDVSDAYFMHLRVYDSNLKTWMDTVIVFYKHKETLLRVSCLVPSQFIEKYHGTFNDVLLSVNFGAQVKKD